MFPNTMSIGESEGSQDTPMRNTTPSKRPRVKTDQSGKAKKKQKMNQCRLAFHVILMNDVTVDNFDANNITVDNELTNMVKKLEDGKASFQETQEIDVSCSRLFKN